MRMSGTQLGRHLEAHYRHALSQRNFGDAVAIQDLAVSLALEGHGADEERAERWLVKVCGLGPAVISRYRNMLEQVRPLATAGGR
jgi:hypothetical protein